MKRSVHCVKSDERKVTFMKNYSYIRLIANKYSKNKMPLSLREKIEIIRLFGDNARSSREVTAVFNLRHPERPPISHGKVAAVNALFNETGSVNRSQQNGQPRRVHPHPEDDIILAANRANPRMSLRDLSSQLNISKDKIRRCFVRHKIKPYKPKFLHTLREGDENLRLNYCYWAQGNFLNDRNFLGKIMFTDEATFTTNGIVSSQNCRYWARNNPNWVINCKDQYSQKVNVWCGILGDRIIGPFFFNQSLNAHRLVNFLDGELWDEIENLPLDLRRDMYFQLDGASIHNSRIVRQWLNQQFPMRWIGRNSPFELWPPRSPDITPLDFYFWGVVKNTVYKTRPRNRDELCARIRQACNEISAVELRRVVHHNQKRIEKCIRLRGGLVERNQIPDV